MGYMDDFYKNVEHVGVVPVVVLDRVEDAVPLGKALAEGGLPAAEVTFRTAAAADSIHAIAQECPDVLVGAGTVLNEAQAKRAVDAGARYIVSPGYDMGVVRWCLVARGSGDSCGRDAHGGHGARERGYRSHQVLPGGAVWRPCHHPCVWPRSLWGIASCPRAA
jgi:2-keto-3-deoxy-6-phosphogluconate aldolase